MNTVNKKSIKIELDEEFMNGKTEVEAIDEVFYQATELLCADDESVTDRFYTFRFDTTANGIMTATVTSARKRES